MQSSKNLLNLNWPLLSNVFADKNIHFGRGNCAKVLYSNKIILTLKQVNINLSNHTS